ncbi:unnamed protein product [Linum trigynum]|uniref:Uncharacterized protein n=1 Tax=Linum trigynum TaxID=586398 RepID=A0AAV2GB43_9ROSI
MGRTSIRSRLPRTHQEQEACDDLEEDYAEEPGAREVLPEGELLSRGAREDELPSREPIGLMGGASASVRGSSVSDDSGEEVASREEESHSPS